MITGNELLFFGTGLFLGWVLRFKLMENKGENDKK